MSPRTRLTPTRKELTNAGTENVRFLDARHLPPGENLVGGIFQRSLLGLWPGVPEIAGVQLVIVGEALVELSHCIVLGRNFRQRDTEGLCDPVAVDRRASGGFRPQFHVASDRGTAKARSASVGTWMVVETGKFSRNAS